MDLEIYEKKEEVKVYSYEDAVILPRIFQGKEPMWGLGGVCTKEGSFAEPSAYDGGWAKHGGGYEWNREEEEFCEQEVIYFGVFYQHWGHFLVDLVGRMWYPACSDEYRSSMKVAYLGEEEPSQNHLEFFSLLGIRKEQLIHVKKPLRCKRVIVPEMAARSCIWYTQEYIRMFDVMTENALKNKSPKKKYDGVTKVYFTRTKFRKARENEFGEELIEHIFTANGYTSIAPEQLTLSEQIFLWNHAERIVCLNGTIPLNAAFCQNPALELAVLNKCSLFHGNPYLFLKMRGIQAAFLDVYREPFRRYPKSLGEGPFLLQVSSGLKEWLKARNESLAVTEDQIKGSNRKNYLRYCFCILGVKRKFRMAAYKYIPKSWKAKIRKIAGR